VKAVKFRSTSFFEFLRFVAQGGLDHRNIQGTAFCQRREVEEWRVRPRGSSGFLHFFTRGMRSLVF
jgi:hypothetical protein